MPIRAFSLLLVLLAVLPAAGASAAKPVFSPMDVFSLEWASDPEISPDGTQVAYVRRSFDVKTDKRRGAIWLIGRDGNDHRPLAGSEASQSSPRWSPDGARLAFVAADANGAQIHMHWFKENVTARVTNLLDTPAGLAWSPDGRQLAFVMRVPAKREPLKVKLQEAPKDATWAEPLKAIDRMVYRADGEGYLPDAFGQVFVVPADGGAPRQLTDGAYDHDDVAWSADGSEILVSANRHENSDTEPNDSEVYAIDVATGAIRALTKRFGPDQQPAASPDGKYVAYTGYDDSYQGYQRARLYLLKRDSGEVRELAADLDRDVVNPTWSRDGRRIYFAYDDQGTTRVAETDLTGRVSNLIDDLGGEGWSRPYGGGSFSVAKDGTIAYSANDVLDPAEVGVSDGGKSRRLTQLNEDLLAQRDLGQVEEIWSTTAVDGRRVQSWLIRPPGYDPAKKYPLILEIHGGPFANYGPRFAAELQLYAAAGYNVLFSNPRGSTSYGEEFGNLIHHAYPGRDFDDLMGAVDARNRTRRRGRQPAVRDRRERRRRADRLDRRHDRPFQGRRGAEAGDQLGELRADRRPAELLLQVLVQRAALGGLPVVLAALSAFARRQRQDADHGRDRRAGLPHADPGVRAVLPGAAPARRRHPARPRAGSRRTRWTSTPASSTPASPTSSPGSPSTTSLLRRLRQPMQPSRARRLRE